MFKCFYLETRKKILLVFNLINQRIELRTISKMTNIPETTILNWKFGYSQIYNANNKIEIYLKSEIVRLLENGLSMPKIAQKLEISYNTLRLFLKRILSKENY